MVSPIELLTTDENRKNTFLFDKWNPVACAATGFGLACFFNWILRRPIYSGIQVHAALTVGGGAIGYFVDQRRNDYLAERDAILRHYIELHPDDFPTPERKKWADVLDVWAPIR